VRPHSFAPTSSVNVLALQEQRDALLRPGQEEILQRLEQRVGPEGRRLFEGFWEKGKSEADIDQAALEQARETERKAPRPPGPYQQNGKTVAIRQFNGRLPPPSTRFLAFLADGAAATGALASGFG
jgi:hypothetical protein